MSNYRLAYISITECQLKEKTFLSITIDMCGDKVSSLGLLFVCLIHYYFVAV